MRRPVAVIHFLSKNVIRGWLTHSSGPWNSNVWLSSRVVDGAQSKDSVLLARVSIVWDVSPLPNGPNLHAMIIQESVMLRTSLTIG